MHFQQALPNGCGGPRNVSKIKSGNRREVNSTSTHRNQESPEGQQVGQCKMDSHADTCCLGSNFIPIYFTGKICNVAPFLNDLPNQEGIPICTGATAYDDVDGNTIILILNEALWFGDQMKHSLINPNQVRAYGISLCDDPTDPHHKLGLTVQDTFIPLVMSGSTCHFTTRTPTSWELDNCLHLEITSDSKWNPNQPLFSQDTGGTDESMESIHIDSYDTRHRQPDVEPSYLAKQWGIGLDTATKTLKATTQAGIQHAIHPLNQQYRMDTMALRHQRLHSTFYSDTLFSGVKSIHGNKCAQVTTDGKFIHVLYPMTSKSKAGCALTAFVQDVGIPEVVVVDGAHEQTGKNTEFTQACQHYRIQQRQTEPYTPRQNRAEAAIGELKKRWCNKMRAKGVPK